MLMLVHSNAADMARVAIYLVAAQLLMWPGRESVVQAVVCDLIAASACPAIFLDIKHFENKKGSALAAPFLYI